MIFKCIYINLSSYDSCCYLSRSKCDSIWWMRLPLILYCKKHSSFFLFTALLLLKVYPKYLGVYAFKLLKPDDCQDILLMSHKQYLAFVHIIFHSLHLCYNLEDGGEAFELLF